MNPKISVIVPIYNSEKYLERCVNSLLNQSYRNLEILLVDDGSTDNSSHIIDQYAKKDCRVIPLHKKNGGVSSARNYGIERISGDYVCFVDSDDYVDEKMYETLLKYKEESKADLVKCTFKYEKDNKIIDRDINYDSQLYNFSDQTEKDLFFGLYGKRFIYSEPTTYLINASLAKKYKFRENYSFGEDLLYVIEIINDVGSVYLSSDKLYVYFQNSYGSVFSCKNYGRNLNNILNVNYDICNIVEEKYWKEFCFSNGLTVYRIMENSFFHKMFKETVSAVSDFSKVKFLISNIPFKKLSLFQKIFFTFLKSNNMFFLKILFIFKGILLNIKEFFIRNKEI